MFSLCVVAVLGLDCTLHMTRPRRAKFQTVFRGSAANGKLTTADGVCWSKSPVQRSNFDNSQSFHVFTSKDLA